MPFSRVSGKGGPKAHVPKPFIYLSPGGRSLVTRRVLQGIMRCDLHVHTIRPGMCTAPALNRICRESYNEPRAVHDALKRRGMDLITITGHDSIDAAEEFRGCPDFFVSEEISCTAPCGSRIHVGVYDIAERDHLALQRRRDDLPAAIAYLRERRIPFSVNHAFSSLTGRRSEKDWDLFGAAFPAFETRNGTMLPSCNKAAGHLAFRLGKVAVAGSDAHTLAGLGETYTEVPGARNAREFLDGLRRGASVVCGAHGNYAKLTAAVWDIGISLMREHPQAPYLRR